MESQLTPKQHREILERYRRTQTSDGWHTAPDDGYLYDHLAYHLTEAGLTDELKGLFADHQWLHARVPQSNYLYDGYLSDLQKVWDAAYTTCQNQIKQGHPLTALVDCFRYALIRTSINSITADYPPELVGRAVELEIWTIERALSIVERAPSLPLYDALLKTGKLDKEHRAKFIQLGYEQVIHRRDHWQDTEYSFTTVTVFLRGLATILPYLDDAQRDEVLNFDLKWLFGYGWGKASWNTQILEVVAPYLSPAQIQIAIEIAFESISRPITLSILAAYVNQNQQREIAKQAYSMALENQLERDIAHGIAAILPYLPDDLRQKALKRGLEAAEKSVSYDRVAGLRRFIPFISEDKRSGFINYVFEQAKELQRGYMPGRNLAELFPYLNAGQRDEAFERILAVPPNSGEQLSDLFLTVFSFLNQEQKSRGLQVLVNVASQKPPMRLPIVLVPIMDRDYVKQCLEQILDIYDEEGKIRSITSVIPCVPPDNRNKLAVWAFTNRNKGHFYKLFSGNIDTQHIINHLSADLLKIAYDEAINASYEERTGRLAGVLPYLGKPESDEALRRTLADRHRYILVALHSELAKLAPALVGEAQGQAVHLALDEILRLEHPHPDENPQYYRENRGLFDLGVAQVIKKLAPYLSAEQVKIAYNILREHTETSLCRAEGFVGLLPYLDEHSLKYAVRHCFEIARENNFRPIREDVLEPTLPYLSDELKKELLQYIFETSDILNAMTIVCKLAPHLAEKERSRVLQWAFRRATIMLNYDHQRPGILSRLAPLLGIPEREQAVQHAFKDLQSTPPADLDEVQCHLSILTRLVKAANEPAAIIQAIQRLILKSLSTQLDERRMAIHSFSSTFLPLMKPPLLSADIHAAIAEQIIDVCENWQWV